MATSFPRFKFHRGRRLSISCSIHHRLWHSWSTKFKLLGTICHKKTQTISTCAGIFSALGSPNSILIFLALQVIKINWKCFHINVELRFPHCQKIVPSYIFSATHRNYNRKILLHQRVSRQLYNFKLFLTSV